MPKRNNNNIKYWSVEEEKKLVNEFKNGIDIKTIAENHGRTIRAINIRIDKIVYEKFNKNGGDIKEISQETGFTDEKINECVESYKSHLEGKNTHKNTNTGEILLAMVELNNGIMRIEKDLQEIKKKLLL